MTEKDIRVRHFYNEANQLTSTIATFEDGNKVIVAVARCSPKEGNRSKKMGRYIATGRLQSYMDGRKMNSNVTEMTRDNFISWLRGEW